MIFQCQHGVSMSRDDNTRVTKSSVAMMDKILVHTCVVLGNYVRLGGVVGIPWSELLALCCHKIRVVPSVMNPMETTTHHTSDVNLSEDKSGIHIAQTVLGRCTSHVWTKVSI